MTLRLYDTRAGARRPFEPQEPGRVKMYTCGPTVYDRAHIGNFRTFAWQDLLRRYLRWKGWEVEQVMNLTDVDDKTIREAVDRGVSLREVTDPVTEAFFEDWETLGLEPVEHTPRATEHVPEMIELIRRLEENGHTYEAEGSVYYDISSFPGYGEMVNLDPEAVRTAGRTEGDEEYTKDDPRDFVLWKGGAREEEGDVATWDSPWGPGRPGWHVECSVLAMTHLGETLDVHAGGIDLVFPHHTNEIAQAEGATGETFSRYWLHGAHLQVEGGKMSKSLGNFYTVPDLLEEGHRPSTIRYLLLSAHYRAELNFTREGLEDADRSLERLAELRDRLRRVRNAGGDGGSGALGEAARRARAAFEEAMDDDLNVSGALAAVFDFVREANARLDEVDDREPADDAEAALAFLEDFDRVFGVLALRERERRSIAPELRSWLEEKIADREAAREAGDYERADAIRDEIEARGIALEDTPEGPQWKVLDPSRAAPEEEGPEPR
jgi:cysteinyl-tRNA synthetase